MSSSRNSHREQRTGIASRSGLSAVRAAAGTRRPMLLAIGVVVAIAAIGGYFLVATKPKPASHSTAGSHAKSQSGANGGGAQQQTGQSSEPTVSITWVGDMTFGTLNAWPPNGTGSLLDSVKQDLHSNLTVGNLETVLGDLPSSKCSAGEKDCYEFEAPDSTAADLKEDGFSAVNVANNHTLDAGTAGVTSTDDALRAAHLKWTGRPGQITYLRKNGIKIALLGFAPWSYDADALDIPAAESLVREAKQHAQIVIVLEHLGAEGNTAQHVSAGEEYFLGQDRGNSIAFTHGVIDAGADLVMGSGPHVLRGMQWYHGHLIAYSLGNFCGYNTLSVNGVSSTSAILHITLNAHGQFVRGNITPLTLVSPGTPEPDPAKAAIGVINSLSRADFDGNGAVHISARGRLARPR